MKSIIVCLFSLCMFCTSAELGPLKSEKELRIVAYNVGVFSKFSEDSMREVGAMMAELGADALALCELDSCNRRHSTYQLQDFCDLMGQEWESVYGSAMQWSGGAYGIGALVSSPVQGHFKIAIPRGEGHEPRACVVVETREYVMAAVHLDHKNEQVRMEQARLVTSELKKRYGRSRKPVFLCGDLNATEDSQTLRLLSEDWTVLSEAAPTYPADGPRICIDYILALNNRARYQVLGSAVCTEFESADVSKVSDHLPVFVDVKIR